MKIIGIAILLFVIILLLIGISSRLYESNAFQMDDYSLTVALIGAISGAIVVVIGTIFEEMK